MTDRPSQIRRLVLVLDPDGAGEAGLRWTGELARLLDLQVVALMIEDERLFHAAGHRFASEISPDRATRQALDPARLDSDFRLAARRSERRLREIARAARLAVEVQRVRGSPEMTIRERIRNGDLAALFAPSSALDRTFGSHAARLRLAEGLQAALMMPPSPAVSAGTVVAVPGDADDTAPLALGRSIAGRAGADLEIWSPGASVPKTGMPPDATVRDLDPITTATIGRLRGRPIPRLLILGAALTPERRERLRALAARLGAPVISLGPAREGD